MIVICSPHAAASRWVNEEIRTFKAMGRADRIFCLIVDGEPFASMIEKSEEVECLPPALRFHAEPDGTLTDRRSDPLAADAREGKDGRSSALLKLIAGILNVRASTNCAVVRRSARAGSDGGGPRRPSPH